PTCARTLRYQSSQLTLGPLLETSGTKTRESAVRKAQAFITVQAGARHSPLAVIQGMTETITLPAAAASLSAQNHVSGLGAPLVAENVLVQELVAELPARVVLPAKPKKVWHPLVSILQCRRRHGRQLSPMWPGMKRGKFFLNYWQQFAHSRPVLPPREVNGNTALFVARTHPQLICRDRPNFGNQ